MEKKENMGESLKDIGEKQEDLSYLTEQRKKHLIVKAFFKEQSLVESNIISFNNFLDIRLQKIVDEINEQLSSEESEIWFGKIRVGKPRVIEADGSAKEILPIEARIRSLTYAAPIYLEIGTGTKEVVEVEIGEIPIMVKSKYCNLHGMNDEELIKNYEDPQDPGGYFIINGNPKVMIMIEDLAQNKIFWEETQKGLVLRFFSQSGSYRIPTLIYQTREGIIMASFSRFKDIPTILLIKALGITNDREIMEYIEKESDSLIVSMYKEANVNTVEEAIMKIGEIMNVQGTKKEIMDRVKARIDSTLMPHLGGKEARKEKAINLCKLVKQFLIIKEKKIKIDKDHYENKRIRLSGDLLEDLFRVNLNIFARDLQHNILKMKKRKKVFSIRGLVKSTLFSHRIESAFATGSWIGERTGVTQNMDCTNKLAVLSQLQRVVSSLPSDQENIEARTLHPTQYGRLCPIETPEGTSIGLRKNLALMARISTEIKEEGLLDKLKKIGLKSNTGGNTGSLDVFWNGRFIGKANKEFVDMVKEERRKGNMPWQLNIQVDEEREACFIATDPGRALRPLIIVKNGKPLLTKEHVEALKENKIGFSDLLNSGVIEYLDALEEENALVALDETEITGETTHLEIDPVTSLGAITSLVPFANHDYASRLNRGSKTQKQAIALYAANFHNLMTTDVGVLHYPQKPIVKSVIYDLLNFYPVGQNVVVAIMPYKGYNMSDALVVSKGSIERGFGRSTYFRPYTSVELRYTGNLKDEITVPSKDVKGYRTEEMYRMLEEDGIVYPEAELKENEAVIGKVSPPKFLFEMGEISLAREKKENSTVIRQNEKGIADTIFITIDGEGHKIVQVRMRDPRIPELGDKFSAAHGQKGVIGLILPEEDLPFSASGIKPDIIFNPHGLPSRMTVSYLFELLAGKVGCIAAKNIDATPFEPISLEELEKMLLELGFRPDGKETFYDGITGKKIEAKIFVGNMYYLKLKYMVGNKIQTRASGKITLLTRQPVEGRAKGGALRLGEMEKDALVAHGASLLLNERFSSDNFVVYVCSKCGALGIRDVIRKKEYCPVCANSKLEPLELNYASKLLLDELASLHLFTTFELKNKYEQ